MAKTTTRLRRLVLVLVVAVAWRPRVLLAQADCGGGVAGILSSDGTTCCLEACGLCGGSGCSDVEGTLDTDCCVNDIRGTDRTCDVVNDVVAPCTIDPDNPLETPAPTPAPTAEATLAPTVAPVVEPTAAPVAVPVRTPAPVPASIGDPDDPLPGSISTCENGYPGFQTQEACCSEFCGQCGGAGCGALGSADCCYDNIINGDRVCSVTAFEAPCIVIPFTPSPLPDGHTRAPLADPTPAPSLAPAVPTPAPVAPVAAPVTEDPLPREIEEPTAAPNGLELTPAPTVEGCAAGLEGFQHGVVCCPLECGQCGGSGCHNLPGGATACCSDVILAGGVRCNGTDVVAPCIIGSVDDVDGAANDETSAACKIWIGGEGRPRKGGVALAVVGLAGAVAALLF
eukprot:g9260.t1